MCLGRGRPRSGMLVATLDIKSVSRETTFCPFAPCSLHFSVSLFTRSRAQAHSPSLLSLSPSAPSPSFETVLFSR